MRRPTKSTRYASCCLPLALLLAGCAPDPTQLVIRVESDVPQPSVVTLVMRRLGSSEPITEQTIPLNGSNPDGGTFVPGPWELGVLSSNPADDRRVELVLTATWARGTVSQRSVVSFVPGRIARTRMYLQHGCTGARQMGCNAMGLECGVEGNTSCGPAERPSVELVNGQGQVLSTVALQSTTSGGH